MFTITFLQSIFIALFLTHITIICVTLYLHRGQSHRAIEFNPIVSHFMRFWLWLTTGMVTKEWVAVHRKHHQAADTIDDPHSPKIHGLLKVLFGGAFLYAASKNKPDVIKLGIGTPDDYIERKLYTPHNFLGIILLLFIDVFLFSYWGLFIWIIQMIWIPFWAAGVVNGLCHWFGYRNYDVKDTSRNIFPWGIIIGGEELHNNHHGEGTSAKLSRKWFEFDIGYFYIRILQYFGLARILR